MRALALHREPLLAGRDGHAAARRARRRAVAPLSARADSSSREQLAPAERTENEVRAVRNNPDGGRAIDASLAADSSFPAEQAPLAASSGAAAAPASPLAALLARIDFSEPISFDGEEKTEYDPLRDGPLRYLGYANELGEAFAAWLFAGGVPLSYGVAISYVLFDTYDKYTKTKEDARQKLFARSDIPASVDRERLVGAIALERGVDTVVWQLIASVAAPGYTIHTIVAVTSALLERAERSSEVLAASYQAAALLGVPADALLATLNKSIPTAVGLLAIPFIVHPIDSGVHALLNVTLRPALRRLVCTEARGSEAGLRACQQCQGRK